MILTDYHAKYFAYELTKRSPAGDVEGLAGVLVDAQIEALPHQVDAALFAFKNPLSMGALLADEVGLGKTIEAGLIIAQKWAEQKRRILVVLPANLRKQWYQELQEKFFLPCEILESRSYNEKWRSGAANPFDNRSAILLCSYQFARSKREQVKMVDWDLVVLDEAHRLRNVYKSGNVTANDLKVALDKKPKVLLTATPLQNSLMELYGLVSFVDDQLFGGVDIFREQYSSRTNGHTSDAQFAELKQRLLPVCHRTLRRQVQAYVRYTNRHSMTEPFTPEESEDRLYDMVSEYLQRPNLMAMPGGQRTLITLVLRKLLASSTFAIAGALQSMINRLQKMLDRSEPAPLTNELDEDYEGLDETAEEWGEDEEPPPPLTESEKQQVAAEIEELKSFRQLALSITSNAKGRALLTALKRAFEEAGRLGAEQKAIIFTESRKTQSYLLRLLSDSPYADGIVLFNGTNTDPESKQIYVEWLARHKGTDKITGSKTADMRSALVDRFREKGKILIATEAGAEGINLQFCSLVVNYDLPWNPQRIEQRIGRCHRYGQKHDVVVVNFLNRNNEADLRVFELLDKKFQLFEGVFGASDEILGSIESGVDFERRIASIYQDCRTPEEIQEAFDRLQGELSTQIDEEMKRTRKNLLEHFDDEVNEKLKVRQTRAVAALKRHERWLLDLTRHELQDSAVFEPDEETVFQLSQNPFPGVNGIPSGKYALPRREGEFHVYRLGHPLAQEVVRRAKKRELPPAEIVFDLTGHPGRVGALEPFAGKAGVLELTLLSVQSLEQDEDYLLWAACSEDGEELAPEVARKLFALPHSAVRPWSGEVGEALKRRTGQLELEKKAEISERNHALYDAEAEKLDVWAEDLKQGLEREIKDLDKQIREAKRSAKSALTLEEKLTGQKRVKALEGIRNTKRRSVFDQQDQIEARRDKLIAEIEAKLELKVGLANVMTIRWKLV